MFTVVAGVTLGVANYVVKQRTNAKLDKPQMDMDMFKDVPFLLMSAGKSILLLKIQS